MGPHDGRVDHHPDRALEGGPGGHLLEQFLQPPRGDPASEPVEWAAEFRFFVRDRRVHAWSPYWLNGSLARKEDEWVVEPEMAAVTRGLVDRLLADPEVDLPVALVLDAGVIKGRSPALVEANEASGAGIYGCDPRDVLEVLRAATSRTVG
ncbi:ATP-grasp domain-containing protein [Paludisphaera soli]|uniref:ATP-grasp domain-containing protein n=1 Tax=Paludisphaera soli TaxID=2712865 RepID=UPI001F0F93E3|nr:ATP-grasp domain-containing protein [Paludisphaera soli]